MQTPALAAHRLEQEVASGRLYAFAWHRRAALRMVIVALALVGSSLHLQRYPTLLQAREAARAAATESTISRPDLDASLDLPSGAFVVGPTIGGSPSLYIEARATALANLASGRHVAVVSLTSVSGVEGILAMLPDDAAILRAQYQMPDARSTPLEAQVIAGDLVTSMTRIIDAELAMLVEEHRSLQELLESGTMESEEFERDARGRLAEIVTVRNVLASDGRIVFAVVIEADAADLRELASHQQVRLVDVLPADADPETSILFGLKPDDVDRVTFGVPA